MEALSFFEALHEIRNNPCLYMRCVNDNTLAYYENVVWNFKTNRVDFEDGKPLWLTSEVIDGKWEVSKYQQDYIEIERHAKP